MTPEAKKPMPAGAEELAALLVERVRRYERNCRCPKCHGQTLQCIDCDFCVANLQKLMLPELVASGFEPRANSQKPAARFTKNTSCIAERIGGNLIAMKTKTRKAKAKAKAPGKSTAKMKMTGRRKPVAKAHTPKARPTIKGKSKTKKAAAAKPKSTLTMAHPKSGDSDRGLYVRFETPEIKARVKEAAEASKVSMNAYIVAATLEWVKDGRQVETPDKPEKEEALATGT